MLQALGRLAAVFCLAVLWLSGPSWGAEAKPASAPRPLTGQEIITLGQSLLAQGQLDEAENLYQALIQSGHETGFRLEAAFQLGQILMARGQFRQAALYFNAILNLRPNLPRVRLELARAYFLDRNYQDAAFQFELVKGGNLPPEVLAKVDSFLEAIRRQKDWTVDFYLTPVSDSNLNQASGGREECLDTAFGRLCRPLTEKAGGYGLSAGASVDYFKRLSQDWGLKASLGFSALEYERTAYDDYSLALALGPRRIWESGEASLLPTFRQRWVAGRDYSRETGLRLEARQIFGRLILDGGGSYSRLRYTEDFLDDFLRGPVWSLNLRPRYILNDRTFIQAGLDFLQEAAKDKVYANDNWRYALGVYRAFPYGFGLYLEGNLTQTSYQAERWYVTRAHRIDETRRRDETLGLQAALSSNLLEKYRLTPTLHYAYTDRRSNIWSQEYQRHRLNLIFDFKY
jgi:tetratricopeptide (TPR) repeat protein